jgi:transposase-like protein
LFPGINGRRGKKQKKKEGLHCTNPRCPNFHQSDPEDSSWWKEHGNYHTKAYGRVQRYRCTCCGTTFSDQSFSIDYYVKKPIDYIPLIRALLSTSGLGNLSRFEGLREELIQNRYERLARTFLALHAHLREMIRKSEDFVLDGLESFSKSRYYPNNINVVVGSTSEYIYGMGFSQLRRKGNMTKEQRQRREEEEKVYGKAPARAVEMSVTHILYDLGKFINKRKTGKHVLFTDEHKAYVRALNRIIDSGDYFEHVQISSGKVRNYTNKLHPANYLDRQIRKDQANHVRETVQYARCPSAIMLRLAIYQVYHNYLMPRRVKEQRRGNWQTRGEYLGISRDDILDAIESFVGKRAFFHKCKLWEEEKSTWLMMWRNSRIPIGRRIPKYIAA